VHVLNLLNGDGDVECEVSHAMTTILYTSQKVETLISTVCEPGLISMNERKCLVGEW